METIREIEYSNGKSIFKGFFHRFLIKKDSDGNEVAVALIENIEGNILEVAFGLIKFKEHENKKGLRRIKYYTTPLFARNESDISKIGFFHFWEQTNLSYNDSIEVKIGVVEDKESGCIIKVESENITFID